MTHEKCWYKEVCLKFPDGCKATCLRYSEMLQLLKLSNIPEERWFPENLMPGADKAEFIKLRDIKSDIDQWVKSGNSLYLYSDKFGNGKTSWAIKLMLAYFNKIWAGNCFRRRGIFLSVPEFFNRNREIISNRDEEFVEIRNDLITCDLVIWDDISSVKMTDYAHSMLLNYMDSRCLAHKANIFTGNMNEKELIQFVGGRLTSRIWNTSTVIKFKDQDKRGVKNG